MSGGQDQSRPDRRGRLGPSARPHLLGADRRRLLRGRGPERRETEARAAEFSVAGLYGHRRDAGDGAARSGQPVPAQPGPLRRHAAGDPGRIPAARGEAAGLRVRRGRHAAGRGQKRDTCSSPSTSTTGTPSRCRWRGRPSRRGGWASWSSPPGALAARGQRSPARQSDRDAVPWLRHAGAPVRADRRVMAEMTDKTGGGYRHSRCRCKFANGAVGSLLGTYDSSYAYPDTHRVEINGTAGRLSSKTPCGATLSIRPGAKRRKSGRRAISTTGTANSIGRSTATWTPCWRHSGRGAAAGPRFGRPTRPGAGPRRHPVVRDGRAVSPLPRHGEAAAAQQALPRQHVHEMDSLFPQDQAQHFHDEINHGERITAAVCHAIDP